MRKKAKGLVWRNRREEGHEGGLAGGAAGGAALEEGPPCWARGGAWAD